MKLVEKYKSKLQIVIGLMGPKGSGKDTLADYSIEKLGATGKIATAHFLKNMCSKVFKLEPAWFNENKDKEFPKPVLLSNPIVKQILLEMRAAIPEKTLSLKDFNPYTIGIQNFSGRLFKTPRQMLQYIGTNLCQSVCRSFHCIVSYDSYKSLPGTWFITDVRFKFEVDYALKTFKFFYPIRIINRNEVVDGQEEHLSESEWKQILPFASIDNSSTKGKFIENSVDVFNKIRSDVEDKLSIMTESELQALFIDNVNNASIVIPKDPNVIKSGRFGFRPAAEANQHIVRDL